jgi:acyl-homoserine-lactone acylase
MAPDAENPRGIHAVRVLGNQKGFTLEKLLEAAYDSYLPAFEHTIPALVRAYDSLSVNDAGMRKDLSGPADQLRTWDTRFSENSVATTLAIYWGQKILPRVRSAKIPPGSSVFDYIATEADPELLVNALTAAVNDLNDDFGKWEVPWGDVNRYQRLTGETVQPFNDDEPSLPVFFASSQWGSLASFAARKYPGTRKMYGTSGNSFVAVVEFGERIKAKSILAGGISGEPDSPHFDDQALMYTKGEFKDVLFYRNDIEANAERTYHPGK